MGENGWGIGQQPGLLLSWTRVSKVCGKLLWRAVIPTWPEDPEEAGTLGFIPRTQWFLLENPRQLHWVHLKPVISINPSSIQSSIHHSSSSHPLFHSFIHSYIHQSIDSSVHYPSINPAIDPSFIFYLLSILHASALPPHMCLDPRLGSGNTKMIGQSPLSSNPWSYGVSNTEPILTVTWPEYGVGRIPRVWETQRFIWRHLDNKWGGHFPFFTLIWASCTPRQYMVGSTGFGYIS